MGDKDRSGPELWASHASMFRFIDEETGELTEEAEMFFERWEMEADEKLEAYWFRTINLEADLHKAKAQRDAAARSVKRIEADIEQIKRLASILLEKKEEAGLKTKVHGIGWGCNLSRRKTLVIDKDAVFSKEYVRIKQTESPDRTKIKQALENGKEIKGAKIIRKNTVSWMRSVKDENE